MVKNTIKHIIGIYNINKQLRFLNFDTRVKKKAAYNNILFVPFNFTALNTCRELLICKKLQSKGTDCSFLYLNHQIEFSNYFSSKLQFFAYKLKMMFTQKLVKAQEVKVYNIPSSITVEQATRIANENIENLKNDNSFQYNNIEIGDLIIAEAVRFMKCPKPLWGNSDFEQTVKKSFIACLQLYHGYKTFISACKPDKIVMSHGIYISWGTLFRLARHLDIPVDVYNGSYRRNTLRFYHNEPNAPMPLRLWNTKYKDIPLNSQEREEVRRYMKTRSTQSEDNITLFSEHSGPQDELQQFIQKARSRGTKIACLFTNVAWDAFAFSGETAFSSLDTWIRESLEFFKDSKYALIVKAHPAEQYFNTPEEYRVKTIVKDYLNYENIYFLDEASNFKSTDVYSLIDLGITFISTVALEMGYLNIPVIAIGGQYTKKGFTLDVDSKEDYFRTIEKVLDGETQFEANIESAERFVFFRFFREAIPFKAINLKNVYTIEEINFKNYQDFVSDPYLEIIANGILNDDEFITPSALILN